MPMVHGSENRAGHFGSTYTRKLNRLKNVLWSLGQLGNHPDKFLLSQKQEGCMKTAYMGLLLAGKKLVL